MEPIRWSGGLGGARGVGGTFWLQTQNIPQLLPVLTKPAQRPFVHDGLVPAKCLRRPDGTVVALLPGSHLLYLVARLRCLSEEVTEAPRIELQVPVGLHRDVGVRGYVLVEHGRKGRGLPATSGTA